jgi:hypothetical protein
MYLRPVSRARIFKKAISRFLAIRCFSGAAGKSTAPGPSCRALYFIAFR